MSALTSSVASWPARALLGLLSAYKLVVSPFFAGSCRYVPSCSAYAREAVERHGAIRGTCLAAWRLARCHPFSRGGLDQVPLGPTHDTRLRKLS